MFNSPLCPYCFRPIGRWKKDPIRLPNGCPNVWVSETETTREYRLDQRFYKGFDQITEPEIQEIQDFLKQAEIDNGITPLTIWSLLNTSGKFQITGKHIKEMRDSVEKLLTNFGLTKTDYFNYDEEGNLITQYGGGKVEWTDPITNSVDLKKFQVKYIHIEDLRHYISIGWQETWALARIEPTDVTSKLSESRMVDSSLGITQDPTGTVIPNYNVYADHLWGKHWWIDGTGVTSLRLAAESGYTGVGNGTSKWEVTPTNFTYNVELHIYPRGSLISHGLIGATRVLNINPGVKCNPNLRLEMDWTNIGTYSAGTNIIISPTYTYSGHTYITADELNSQKANMRIGGQSRVRIEITGGYYVDFISTFGQHVTYPSTSHQVTWVPDGQSGMNLYTSFLVIYPALTPLIWASATITAIRLDYAMETLSTTYAGYTDEGYRYIFGYTENVWVKLDSSIDNIKLITRSP